MLKDALQYLTKLAHDAQRPEVIQPPGDPYRFVLTHNGSITTHQIPAPRHAGTRVETLDDLLTAVQHYGAKEPHASASIWHSHPDIIAVLSDSERREMIHMRLAISDVYIVLDQLPQDFQPKDLVRFIRRKLAAAIDPTAADPFRSVDFSQHGETAHRHNRDQESLGRSVNAAVSPGLPDTLTAHLQLYTNIEPHTVPVTLAIDPEPQLGILRVSLLPDAMAYALDATQAFIHNLIRQSIEAEDINAAVFWGAPQFTQ